MTVYAPAVPAPAESTLHQLRWIVTDTITVTGRELAHWRRQPGAVITNTLLFPIMIVLMFGYLLGGAMTVPGGGNYLEFLLPGMFAMTMVFGIGASMIAVSADAARGITDRFRSMPTSAVSILAGRALADMLNSTVALAALLACGLAIGWHPHHGLGSALGAIGLLLLLRFAFLWIGVYLGLRWYDNPEAITAIRTLEFPIGFLGNPFVATATMPAWLGAIATWNPLSATTTAVRDLFGNPTGADHSWITQHATVMAIAWPLLLTAIFLPLAVHRYRNLTA
ncbi:ABC-type multidrug transporter, permease component [Nocardia nova SH22a]|uniref:Transport permease protein n=1 Tax=Nocardia nova SH22a TaxID=1415166 RepID=W5TQ16_9NOCA|nr:ABC transporter permease [Nocardia nova]AHH21450.1 ABC-type multidrug transporter, permease component [Nocardia nova SH22a]